MTPGMSKPSDPDVPPPDKSSTPPPIPYGPSQDFIMGVYTQLSQIQRDLGSVVTAQKMLTDQVQASELRVSSEVKSSEIRVSAQIKDSETRVTERVKGSEDKLSSLKDRVNKVFWTGSAIGIVIVALYGWKPVVAWVSHRIGVDQSTSPAPSKKP